MIIKSDDNSNWKCYELFGSVRLECKDCGFYTTEFTEIESFHAMKQSQATRPYCFACTNMAHYYNALFPNSQLFVILRTRKRNWRRLWTFLWCWWRRELI